MQDGIEIPDQNGGGGDGLVGKDATVTCTAQGLTPGNHTFTLQHGGKQRTYIVHVPKGYTNKTHVPLVLAFHGLGGSAATMGWYKIGDKSDAEGFVAVYPDGYQNSWNAGSCCGDAQKEKIDDVGFVRALVKELEKKVCLDKKRIFATGMSNGGMMSFRLGCAAADLVAAIAPVAGTLGLSSCASQRPVPLMMFNGTKDTLVQYTWAKTSFNTWVTKSGCTGQPVETFKKGMVTCATHKQCKGGVEVTLCTIDGGGHCWPGKSTCTFGTPTTDIVANDAMWTFFKGFPMP